MEESKLYRENLARFFQANPDATKVLENVDASHLQFCKTDAGEENLLSVKGGIRHYYHAQSGAQREAVEWVENYAPFHTNVLVVFGIGLGYLYDALETWFQTDPGKLLIVLEDDPALIRRFLETERASRLLSDPRVLFQYFEMPGTNTWNRFRMKFEWIFSASILNNCTPVACDAYLKWRPHEAQLITRQFALFFDDFTQMRMEYIDGRETLARNYYGNFHLLQESSLIHDMEEKFPGIPALVCGAGPSLDMIMGKLPSLRDRALIFGSGTAMNILTRNGFRPHFGIALDPQDIQESRYLSSCAYEIPYFFMPRFNYKAAQWFQNPLIYVDVYAGIPLYVWLNKKMSFTTKTRTFGRSSSTASATLAGFLGANPIVLAGMNLAYHEGARYAAGSGFYPATDMGTKTPRMAGRDFSTVGARGEEMETNWTWIVESSFYTNFVERNPDKSLINVTEGGLQIYNVPSLNFEDIVARHFGKPYDLDGWIHAEIQLSRNLKYESKRLMDLFIEWKNSLQHCLDFFSKPPEIVDVGEWMATMRKAQQDPDHNVRHEGEKSIVDEPAYLYFLKQYEAIKFSRASLELKKIDCHQELYSEEEVQKIVFKLEEARYQLFKTLCEESLQFIGTALDGLRARSEEDLSAIKTHVPGPSEDEDYSYENGRLTLRDPEFRLDHSEEWLPDDRFELRYKSGKLKGEMLYKNGEIHGPSSFYNEAGKLLSRTWFIDGKREGKAWRYDGEGKLSALQRYRQGALEGRQEYFYPDGCPRTILEFHQDRLQGKVSEFYPNGKQKRIQHFEMGKLNGPEQVWDDTGVLAIEVEYRDNQPVGTMRTWHPNGKLAKEVVIHSDTRDFDLTMWNEEGIVIKKQISLPEHPLEAVLKQSAELESTLAEMADKLNMLIEAKRRKQADGGKSQ